MATLFVLIGCPEKGRYHLYKITQKTKEINTILSVAEK